MGNETNFAEVLAFVLYLGAVLTVGIVFFVKSLGKKGGDKDYFLGGRQMNGVVAALSAGASDMSAWVLMGLPGAIYLYGMGQVWISVGLWIGTIISWIYVAPKLRRYSIVAKDSITIPQFLTNRFLTKGKALQVISAIIFIVAYCVYAASSIVACGNLFNTVFGMDKNVAMIGATVIILIYTFLGGFSAVCWTDFIQGILMLVALMAVPIIAAVAMGAADFAPVAEVVTDENYYNILSSGSFDWASIADILSGLGWGLGYMGMPHILIRYMSIRSEKDMKRSQKIGCFWTTIILVMASVVGLVGHEFLGTALDADSKSMVFITMVRKILVENRGAILIFVAGILLAAILAASMSTADSQLLASASAFASDFYKPILRKNASDKEMLWVGRAIVAGISVVALIIAMTPSLADIMNLVENAWGAFGASFGPAIVLALGWKRLTYSGAVAGIVAGFTVDVLWLVFLSSTGIYEIIPGFIAGLIAAVVVSLASKEPSKEVIELFEKSRAEIN
ncbi:MAG: sodium/proline symporter [Lachnospiraceae bacterium]|nr:sodium/proline symporter [Lachnospiraceae bacterium]